MGNQGLLAVAFDVNHPLLYVIVAVILALVMAQSVFFLVRAIKRAKQKGMDMKVVKNTIKRAAIFTIAPAIGIFIGIISLTGSLGIPLPWLRLSVIGSLTYETTAAEQATNATLGLDPAVQFVTIAFVMTLGILVGLVATPLLCKKIQGGLVKIQSKDKKWGEIFVVALYMGMISAFLGFIFCDFSTIFVGDTSGLIPVVIMLISALLMAVCGILIKRLNWKWLNDYALPLCMIFAMVCAIPVTAWLA